MPNLTSSVPGSTCRKVPWPLPLPAETEPAAAHNCRGTECTEAPAEQDSPRADSSQAAAPVSMGGYSPCLVLKPLPRLYTRHHPHMNRPGMCPIESGRVPPATAPQATARRDRSVSEE